MIITSLKSKHIDGRKEATHDSYEVLNPKFVEKIYFPTLSGNGKPIKLVVSVGQEVKVGTVLGYSDGFEVPYFSSVSGKIVGEENRFNALVGRPINHLVIENDNKDTKEEPLSLLSLESTKEELIARLKECGLVGLGGAGFPTFVKYGAKDIKTIIINACECEPFLNSDYTALMREPELFVQGCKLLMKAASAEKVIICTKKVKEDLVATLNSAIEGEENVSLFLCKDVYPAGWERYLVNNVLKKDYAKLPSEVNAIVSNCQTALCFAKACFSGERLTHRIVTVSGDSVASPKNLLAPIGTPISSLVEACGGYTNEQVWLIAGGPMCSKSQMNDQFVTEKQTGGVVVLAFNPLDEEPCLRCGKCVAHCPSSLQPVAIKDAVEAKDVERMKALHADECVECGMCSYVCPSKINVTEAIRKAKLQIRIANAKK